MEKWKRLYIFNFKVERVRIIRFIIVVLLLSANIILANQITRTYNQHTEEFLKLDENPDVLVIGSSHAYVNLNAAVMWDRYRIRMSSLGQGSQSPYLSYLTLEMALKYHKPQMVIYEVYMCAVDMEILGKEETDYINTFYGFPMLCNLSERVEAAKKMLANEKCLEYIIGFPIYHKQIVNLKKRNEDIVETAGFDYVSGKSSNPDAFIKNYYNTGDNISPEKMTGNNAEYLEKIIGLCEKENIELLLLVTPYQMTEEQAGRLKTVNIIAEQKKIRFIDMNLYSEDIGFKYDEDLYDGGHCNYIGSEKNSEWLGMYIFENFRLKDRAESSTKWEKVSEEYRDWKVDK